MAASIRYSQPGVAITAFSIETLNTVVCFRAGYLTVVAAYAKIFIDKQGIGRFAQAVVEEEVQQAF